MNFRPLGDRVLIKRGAADERSKGGIIIPDNAKEKPIEGDVIATGRGKIEHGKLQEPLVKAGDRVLFGKYAGTEVRLDGVEHVVLREEEILGIVEK